jgi:hypothetical protein
VSDYLLHELAAPLVIDETLSGTAAKPFLRAGAKAGRSTVPSRRAVDVTKTIVEPRAAAERRRIFPCQRRSR